MRSTPISLLYAISRFPLLQDKIITSSALIVIKAEAQGNLLGEDYRTWDQAGCDTDGWTPFRRVRFALERSLAKKFDSRIHPQEIIDAQTLEGLVKCKFHITTRDSAIRLHEEGRLIPENPDIAIWTDGSLTRHKNNNETVLITGAAVIVHISNYEGYEQINEHPVKIALQIENAVSSYETEIIAIQAGLESVLKLEPNGREIHLFTDSLSCIQQLASLPYKYKYSNTVVKNVAEQLAKLTEGNHVEIHFVPSQTENKIAQSEEIDTLAKYAAELGEEEIEHDPLVSSYKLVLKEREKLNLTRYLESKVKASQFNGYPDRKPLVKGRIYNSDGTHTQLQSNNALLNRTRTGHTRSRAHLKNIKIEKEDTCRHCGNDRETIQHQLLQCKKYEKILEKFREQYDYTRKWKSAILTRRSILTVHSWENFVTAHTTTAVIFNDL